MPRPPRPPIKPWLSPDFYFAVLDVQQIIQPTGYKFVVTTDVPCRLCMRWSTNPPQYHTIPSYRRGVYMHGDRYICFTAYHDNWQIEPGEGKYHTFMKLDWPSCETRWFYFWGTKGVIVMNSTSCVFEKHFLAPAPPPIREYLPCWHNRHIYSTSGTWATCRNGAGLKKSGDYQRPNSALTITTSLVATYHIYRAYQNFETFYIPIGATITAARLGLYVTAVPNLETPIYITKGLWDEPVIDTDFLLQTPEVTSLGSRLFTPADVGKYAWIDLNAAGIAWINQRPLEINQHESYDWRKTAYLRFYADIWISQSYTPQTTHTITSVRLRMRRRGLPGTLYITIKAADANHFPTGPVLASGTIDANTFTTAAWGDWYLIDLGAGAALTAGTEYVIEAHIVGGTTNKAVEWVSSTGSNYPNGTCTYSSTGGASWLLLSGYSAYFIEYESAQVGGTKFCLRTAPDLGDSPPGAGAIYSVVFHSAQKGEGFLPILELTLA